MNYASRCKFYEVTVRGRHCEVTDHPDGRRTYMAWHEGADKLREVPEREALLRADIDAAIAALLSTGQRINEAGREAMRIVRERHHGTAGVNGLDGGCEG